MVRKGKDLEKVLKGKSGPCKGNLLDYVRSIAPDENLARALGNVLEERSRIRPQGLWQIILCPLFNIAILS